jgi:hypothetical protein
MENNTFTDQNEGRLNYVYDLLQYLWPRFGKFT